jgi:ubiquinone/menaquinone biosynthesis C-methylase UbiE
MLTQSPRIQKLTIFLFVLGVLATNYLLYLCYRGNIRHSSIGINTIENKHNSSNWLKIWEKKGTSALKDTEPLHYASGFNQIKLDQWRKLVATVINANKGSLKRFKKGDHIVDFGCGAGAFLEALGAATKTDRLVKLANGLNDLNVYGIDYSETLLRVARKRVVNGAPGHFFNSDIKNVKFLLDGSFDHSISWSVFFYLSSLEDAISVLREMVRVIKINGSIIIADVSSKEKEDLARTLRGASAYYTKMQQKRGATPGHLYYPKEFFLETLPKLGVRVDAIIDESDMKPSLSFYEPSQYRFTVFATKVE